MHVVTVSRLILLVGVILMALGAFGVAVGPASLFEIGVTVAFASFLVP